MTKHREKLILTGTIGSHGYGTATPESDYDYMSVVVGPPDIYFGLETWGNAGTKDDTFDDPVKGIVEHKYYEIRKFISMCAGMNPNAIPLLWLDPKHYDIITPEGKRLLDNRGLFSSKRAYNTFSGYAHGQLHKMGGVFNDHEEDEQLLRSGYLRFQTETERHIVFQRDLRDGTAKGPSGTDLPSYDPGYLAALLKLNAHSKEEVKRIKIGPITGRMGAKRKVIRDQYGYDTKFAYHTIRLMTMCVEFLTKPEDGLRVYRKHIDGDFLYSIRNGALSQEEVKALADELFAKAKEAVKTSSLPDEPDKEKIHRLTMDIIRMSIA